MKLKTILSIAAAIAIAFSGCAKVEETGFDSTESPAMASIADVQAETLSNSQNIQLEFDLNLLKELSKNEKNLFYSSFSINQALSMALFGAEGETQQEIIDVLGYSGLNTADIAAYQKYLLEAYEETGDTTFYSANSMWIDNDIILNKTYIDTMVKYFSSDVENLDLQSSDAPDILNKWIDKKTNGMITKLYEEPFDALTRLVLMNAIYFKGQWTNPFNPDLTSEAIFNGLSGQNTVDMMYSDAEVLGWENDDYKAISLPYGDDERFKMVAVLPEGSISDFIAGLDSQELSNILTNFEIKNEAKVWLPKFEMEEKINLSDTLKALGIVKAFTGEAQFGEISDTELFIDEVLHKAKIKVDEEGTEAAAVTGLVMKANSLPLDMFQFSADRPFIFFIADEDNTVLFTGVIYDMD
ncbi:MAG: serpin family protein [Clostridia bacterium]|nr:serpin family protein [Clostridia bacterium]